MFSRKIFYKFIDFYISADKRENNQEGSLHERHTQNRLLTFAEENERKASNLREALKSKQNAICDLQVDVSTLKKENLKYEKKLKEVCGYLGPSGYRQRGGTENEYKHHYEEKIKLLHESHREICKENERLRQENQKLQVQSEELKQEIDKSRENEQLHLAIKQFEDSQEKLSTMEKLCIQQRFEINELDDVVENFRLSIVDQQGIIERITTDNNKLKKENARISYAKAKIEEQMGAEERQKKALIHQIHELDRKFKEEGETVNRLREKLENEASAKEKRGKQLVQEQTLNDHYKTKLDKALKANDELEEQLKIKSGRLEEYKKRLEFMVEEMKAMQEVGVLEGSGKIQVPVEKMVHEKKNERMEIDDVFNENFGEKYAQNDKETGRIILGDNTEGFKKTSSATGDEKRIASLENKTEWLAQLCLQCKCQNDYMNESLEKLLKNNMKNKGDFGGTDEIFKEKLEHLQNQLERYQVQHEKEAKVMHRAFNCMQQNVQKLNDVNTSLSERIDRVQNEVATIKEQVCLQIIIIPLTISFCLRRQ